ncbi:hypothetical protein J539_1045 [Acinetobacter baumannii 342950]|uniref:hypothetical protein n=1 Tax=Acinetobacter baumannii TaxID=470 RepID=UPI000451FD8F|nr:hypothetical protein [Acinetobacter baumannii]EXC02605.1 hypothetical protein J539_1045 [Acinetobacter baumannii 342950]
MLFSSSEKDNFVLFKDVIDNLNISFDKIEANYLTADKQTLDFGTVAVVYNDFKNKLNYTFKYLERVFSESIENKKLKMDLVLNKINDLNYQLNLNLNEDHDIVFALHSFSLRFFSIIQLFLYDVKNQKNGFERIFDNYMEAQFSEFFDLFYTVYMGLSEKNSTGKYRLNSLFDNLSNLKSTVEKLEDKTILNESVFQQKVNDFFKNNVSDFENKANQILISFTNYINEIQNPYESELKQRIDLLTKSVESSQSEVDNLDQAIESYKSLVSKKVQNEISKHYKNKADMEKKIYWRATNLSISLILFSLGLLAWGLIDYYYDYISTSSCLSNEDFKSCVTRLETIRDITKNIGISFFVMRFVFSLLLFLTVIYTSRIASRAYSHWRHSENMHLKLSSLEPFITELPKEVRHEIHRDLIPDYFGKDAGLVDTANEKFKDLPANVSAVAMKAIEQISSGGSNSSTERNGKNPDSGTQ